MKQGKVTASWSSSNNEARESDGHHGQAQIMKQGKVTASWSSSNNEARESDSVMVKLK